MTETLNQLGQLFVQTIPTVIFVFILLVILDRWLFQPLTAILKQRHDLTTGALARAKEQAAQAEAKLRDYETAFQAARQEIYRLREEARRSALAEREQFLKKAREEAQALVSQAKADVARQIEAAKQEFERACQSLALAIVDVVLGEDRSTGPGKGVRV